MKKKIYLILPTNNFIIGNVMLVITGAGVSEIETSIKIFYIYEPFKEDKLLQPKSVRVHKSIRNNGTDKRMAPFA